MAKYFKNITSLEELKKQFRQLAKANHTDNGGDTETMKEINVEFDALFAIWRNKKTEHPQQTEEQPEEKNGAQYRHNFYTANGWEGSRYNGSLTLKEIASIVRAYVKEKYPTCKFSVRTHYASMCQSLNVDLKEFPSKMYKTVDDLKNEGLTEHVKTIDYTGNPFEYDHYKKEIDLLLRKMRNNYIFTLDSWTDEDIFQAYEKALERDKKWFGIKTDYFESVIKDVENFINSYNYSDCDGMTDYFDVNFWFHGIDTSECKQVVKTARISKKSTVPATKKPSKADREAVKQAMTAFSNGGYNKAYETIYALTIADKKLNTAYILAEFQKATA